jgi:gamma-glutamylcyclotransferase (GGCT)/AIG2-like uncharacterized protein YtfP
VSAPGRTLVFICGSALRGQPDHHNLPDAAFLRAERTTPDYRLHAAADGWHPAIHAVESDGIAIPGELYALTDEEYAVLEASEPPHLYAASVTLEGGGTAIAFLYPRALTEQQRWPDISAWGGWAAWKAAGAPHPDATEGDPVP